MFYTPNLKIAILVLVVFCTILAKLKDCECQLVINVKNQGGDIVQESITSNITDDSIVLEFQRPEGTLITQFIDFKSVNAWPFSYSSLNSRYFDNIFALFINFLLNFLYNHFLFTRCVFMRR